MKIKDTKKFFVDLLSRRTDWRKLKPNDIVFVDSTGKDKFVGKYDGETVTYLYFYMSIQPQSYNVPIRVSKEEVKSLVILTPEEVHSLRGELAASKLGIL